MSDCELYDPDNGYAGEVRGRPWIYLKFDPYRADFETPFPGEVEHGSGLKMNNSQPPGMVFDFPGRFPQARGGPGKMNFHRVDQIPHRREA